MSLFVINVKSDLSVCHVCRHYWKSMSNPDPYYLLGISQSASEHDIHKAYKYLRKVYHPNNHRGMDQNQQYVKLFKQTQNAYMNLCQKMCKHVP